MRLKSAIEDLKKDQTRHSEVLRENRNLKEEKEIAILRDELRAEKDKVATAVKERSDDDARSSVTLEKIKDELRLANREAAAAKDLQRRSATKLEETEKQVESLKERLNEKGRSTANANKEIASLRDELRAEREKVATASKERSDGDARRSAILEKIKEDLRLATRELETAKDRERRSAKKLEESEREVESLKEWLDVTEKNHEANLREFRSSVESDKAKAISDLETAKADHSDRTDILRTEIADLKEKLAEATRKEPSLIKDVEKLPALKDENKKEKKAKDELQRTSRDLAAAKEAEIRLKSNHEKIENEIPQWKQWVEELKKARDESHESHAKELGSLRDNLEREKSDAETKLATAKASHSDEIENLETHISFLKKKESKLRKDTGKLHAALKEREEKHLDRIAKLESDKISRSAEAEEALDECASLSEKLKLATDSERRSKEDLNRWQAEKRSWQATAERRSADLDKLRDLLKTSERERANLESQLSNVDKNVTDSKETDSLKRELERHRQEIRQLERLLSDEKREKSGESNDRMISELSKELKTVIDARDRLVKENTEMEKRLSESEKSLSNLYDESMKKVVHLEESVFSKNKEAEELRSDLTKTKMEMDEIKRQLNFSNNKVAEAYSEVTRIVENSEDGRLHEECRELLTRRLDDVERSLEKERIKAANCEQMNK
ncbi:myosin heavy chain, cardiac muscle isoform-like [Anneissia japonica]|uniref:myosin heavy chain, cardiac muscle isoform-like n=1 Tax=Anneissia japonica TaxID=1529436 RepID=UPI0014259C24|nr:myosin heavy chain, cardiac muscle isoform-like [Anneissia japonica]